MLSRYAVCATLALLAAVPRQVHAEDLSFLYITYSAAIEDAEVCSGEADSALGTQEDIWGAWNNGSGGTSYGYFKFEVPEFPANTSILGARLLLHGGVHAWGDDDDYTVGVRTASSSWSQNTITWNDRPRVSRRNIATQTLASPGDDATQVWDVKSAVTTSRGGEDLTFVTMPDRDALLSAAIFASTEKYPSTGGGLNGGRSIPHQQPRLEIWAESKASDFFQSFCTDCHQPPCDADFDTLLNRVPEMVIGYGQNPAAGPDSGCGMGTDESDLFSACAGAMEPLVSYIWENLCGNTWPDR